MSTAKTKTKLLFVTDPWDTLDHENDTTLRLAAECLKLGAQIFWCDLFDIQLEDGRTRIHAKEILDFKDGHRTADETELSGEVILGVDDLDQIHYRVDPPVNTRYTSPLLLLHRAVRGKKPTIDSPLSVLLTHSEKLLPADLSQYAPRTKVAAEWAALEPYGKKLGHAILKPLNGAQSVGVEKLDFTTEAGRAHARAAVIKLTRHQTRAVVLQEFLKGIAQGETRIWYLDGSIFATAQKVPQEGTAIIDMDHGGTVVPYSLTDKEKPIAKAVGRWLEKNGIRMAAVDLIDAKITDLNYTSPGLIVAMEKALGKPLAPKIAAALMKRR